MRKRIPTFKSDRAAEQFVATADLSDYDLINYASGIEAVRRIREKYGDALPAMIITGKADSDVVATIKTCGLEMLGKPVMPANLRALVDSLLLGR